MLTRGRLLRHLEAHMMGIHGPNPFVFHGGENHDSPGRARFPSLARPSTSAPCTVDRRPSTFASCTAVPLYLHVQPRPPLPLLLLLYFLVARSATALLRLPIGCNTTTSLEIPICSPASSTTVSASSSLACVSSTPPPPCADMAVQFPSLLGFLLLS